MRRNRQKVTVADLPGANVSQPIRRLRPWVAVTVVVLLAGSAVTIGAARAAVRRESAQAHRAFVTSSAETASALRLALQHEDDLVISAGGFVVNQPNAASADFARWAGSVRAL